GARVAVGTYDDQNKEQMSVCDLESGERLFSSAGYPLAYSPDGRWLAVRAADNKALVLWDTRTYQRAAQLSGHTEEVQAAAFSPDGRQLVSTGMDRTVRVWEVATGECVAVLSGHTDEVFTAAFHPDGTRLATAGRDRAIWLWDLTTGQEVARLQG